MSSRRILSLWFPRLAAEQQARREGVPLTGPLAIVADQQNAQVLSSLSVEAEAEGLRPGQALRDATAMCPTLVTRLANPVREAAFLAALRRWSSKFSPWVAEEAPAALVIDMTGCAHLFGGEQGLLDQVAADCADLGLTVHMGLADTVGAAWALARFAGQSSGMRRNRDAIDQEARATRSRAAKRRHWVKGGALPTPQAASAALHRVAPRGQTRTALAPLPLAALRLPPDVVAELTRLGVRRVDDLAGMPRAALARRFGRIVVQRLDQALGVEPEPVSPARQAHHFAVRLTLPEPIGLETDIVAAIDRLLPPFAKKLQDRGRGVRLLRLQCARADGSMQTLDMGLARPSNDPDRMRPLILLKLGDIDAGFGIDMVRLEARVSEPVHALQHKGHLDQANAVVARMTADTGIDDLIGRLGGRVGLEAITRQHPTSSNIPEKTATVLAAAWSEPAKGDWPAPPAPRPLVMFRPEMVTADEIPAVPSLFRWRGRQLQTASATGPERISPEWWLDDPNWRSGVRDYWRVETTEGERLWLYFAHGGTMSAGWFCQGEFA